MGELTSFLKLVGEVGFPICLACYMIWQNSKSKSENEDRLDETRKEYMAMAEKDRKEYIGLLNEKDRKNIEFISTRVTSMREELIEAREETKEAREEIEKVRKEAKEDIQFLRHELKEEREVFKTAVDSFVKTVDRLDTLTHEVDEIRMDVKILKETKKD